MFLTKLCVNLNVLANSDLVVARYQAQAAYQRMDFWLQGGQLFFGIVAMILGAVQVGKMFS